MRASDYSLFLIYETSNRKNSTTTETTADAAAAVGWGKQKWMKTVIYFMYYNNNLQYMLIVNESATATPRDWINPFGSSSYYYIKKRDTGTLPWTELRQRWMSGSGFGGVVGFNCRRNQR